MAALGRLATLILGLGIVMQGCDLSDLNLADITYPLTVTNKSATTTAVVNVIVPDGASTITLKPGESLTHDGYETGPYTIQLADNTYPAKVAGLRLELTAILLNGGTPDQLKQAQADDELVEAAARQAAIEGQTCSGTLAGPDTDVTLTTSNTSGGTAIWSLTCNART